LSAKLLRTLSFFFHIAVRSETLVSLSTLLMGYRNTSAKLSSDQTIQREESSMISGLQLRDYRLTTAEILYHLPDHPGLLQTFIWQELDLAPRFPALRRFLQFWARELDGPLHSIRVATGGPIRPASMRHTPHMLHLH